MIDIDKIDLESINSQKNVQKEDNCNEIAIIGIGIKLPDADDFNTYWHNISNRIDSVKNLSEKRKKKIEEYLKYKNIDIENMNYPQSAYIDDIDCFDDKFFNMIPKEASLINPAQRIFIETAWKAIEDAGYSKKSLSGSKTGLYVGLLSDLTCYKYKKIIKDVDPTLLSMSAAGNISSMIPSRISYMLNLKGPSMLIDTACSSSLVATHLACKSIITGDCDMALVGGVRIELFPQDMKYQNVGAESDDYRTRTFDYNSDGYVTGEGSAAIMLKKLSDAQRDGDNIYAVIKGSAINQDGTSMGITAPNPESQTSVILEAWDNAAINPESLSYIEAHGTATKIGDPIEIDSLTKAFRKYTEKKQFCAIGSVKTNLGHLYECSGLAGLIKCIAILKNREIPASIHFKRPNSKIDFQKTPLYINTRLRKCNTDKKLIVGISSFGITGTNCHMVLEEYKAKKVNMGDDGSYVLTISAKSEKALETLINDYYKLLLENNKIDKRDLCFTSSVGRNHYNYRLVVIVDNKTDIKDVLLKVINNNLKEEEKCSTYLGNFRIVSDEQINRKNTEITQKEQELLTKNANEKIIQFLECGDNDLLKEVCELYVKGASVNWESLYQGKKANRISIPSYPFEKNKHWIEIPKDEKKDVENPSLYYSFKWKNVDCKHNIENNEDMFVVIGNKSKIAKEISEKLQGYGNKVLNVIYGNKFEVIDENTYVINQYDSLAKLKEFQEAQSIKIIDCLSVENLSHVDEKHDIDKNIENGVLNLFRIIKGISTIKDFEIVIISKLAYRIDGSEEDIIPENAALFGLGQTVNKEFNNIYVKGIDIDDNTNVDLILPELFNIEKTSYISGFRNNKKYVKELNVVNVEQLPKRDLTIKEEGVYVIAGGMGGIGLKTAELLSRNGARNIVLLCRTDYSKQPMNNKIKEKMQCIEQMRKAGNNIEIMVADISKEEDVQNVINLVEKKYIKINGIVHAAGVADNKFISETNEDEFYNILKSKIYGTRFLDKYTANMNLDFLILYSSIATVFTSAGQGSYVAANAFLDSYAQYRNKNVLTVNWGTWKDTGMAFDYKINVDTMIKAMNSEIYIKALDNVLHKNINNIIITEINYNKSTSLFLNRVGFLLDDNIKSNKLKYENNEKSNKTNSVLLGKDNTKFTNIEKELGKITQKILGISEINIYDSFFELGADSIMIKNLHLELEKIYPGAVTIGEIFQYPSIYKLGKYISEKNTKQVEFKTIIEDDKKIENKIDDMYQKMLDGDMSIDDVIKNIKDI
ncbi:MAG: SDR family NAD(P)-dependent oxidoreductase [Clostridium sp.]